MEAVLIRVVVVVVQEVTATEDLLQEISPGQVQMQTAAMEELVYATAVMDYPEILTVAEEAEHAQIPPLTERAVPARQV